MYFDANKTCWGLPLSWQVEGTFSHRDLGILVQFWAFFPWKKQLSRARSEALADTRVWFLQVLCDFSAFTGQYLDLCGNFCLFAS